MARALFPSIPKHFENIHENGKTFEYSTDADFWKGKGKEVITRDGHTYVNFNWKK